MTTTQRVPNQLLGKHCFCFNGHDNGGESFGLETKVWNKSGMLYKEQEFSLNSYCNSSQFKLNGETITTDSLRQLANELDKKATTLVGKAGRQNTLLDIHKFTFILSPGDDNTLSLTTEYFDNGDGVPDGIYTNQRLTMQSYGNTASFLLCGTSISSEQLRKLANELDVMMATIDTDGLED
jgi:cell division protein ZapA (FtsZ GTPase activity inhibitor)